LDELKTHLRGARILLRSKTPDLVRQEFYGLLLARGQAQDEQFPFAPSWLETNTQNRPQTGY